MWQKHFRAAWLVDAYHLQLRAEFSLCANSLYGCSAHMPASWSAQNWTIYKIQVHKSKFSFKTTFLVYTVLLPPPRLAVDIFTLSVCLSVCSQDNSKFVDEFLDGWNLWLWLQRFGSKNFFERNLYHCGCLVPQTRWRFHYIAVSDAANSDSEIIGVL